MTARILDYVAAVTRDEAGRETFIADAKVLSVRYPDGTRQSQREGGWAAPERYQVLDLATARELEIAPEEIFAVNADPDEAAAAYAASRKR